MYFYYLKIQTLCDYAWDVLDLLGLGGSCFLEEPFLGLSSLWSPSSASSLCAFFEGAALFLVSFLGVSSCCSSSWLSPVWTLVSVWDELVQWPCSSASFATPLFKCSDESPFCWSPSSSSPLSSSTEFFLGLLFFFGASSAAMGSWIHSPKSWRNLKVWEIW